MFSFLASRGPKQLDQHVGLLGLPELMYAEYGRPWVHPQWRLPLLERVYTRGQSFHIQSFTLFLMCEFKLHSNCLSLWDMFVAIILRGRKGLLVLICLIMLIPLINSLITISFINTLIYFIFIFMIVLKKEIVYNLI